MLCFGVGLTGQGLTARSAAAPRQSMLRDPHQGAFAIVTAEPRVPAGANRDPKPMRYLDSRRGRALQLALLVAAYLAMAPYAATHLDFARDVYVALRLFRGEELPMLGPPLAGIVHLGPIWYYALAAPVALGLSWLGVVAFVALIGALQFPLAYLAGKALHSRAAGMAWACLLLLPSWSTFESLLPGHTQWTATLLLAALVAALRFWRGGRGRYVVLLALASSLAVHAHPTATGLAWIGLATVVLGWRRRDLGWGTIAVAATAALLPILPMLIEQIRHGMPMIEVVGDAWRGRRPAAELATVPLTLARSVVVGLTYWLETVFAVEPLLVTAFTALFAILLACGGAGYAWACREPAFRRLGLAAFALGAVVILTASLLRPQVPYYMTTVPRVLALGIAAVGLACLLGPRLRLAFVALAVVAQAALAMGAGQLQMRGGWPVAVYPMFDVNREAWPHRPLLMLPAYAAGRSASFLCQQPLAVHGAYALHVLHGYAVEARLACGDVDVLVGGAGDAKRAHWIGLPRHLLSEAAIAPEMRIGPVGLLPVRRVLGAPVAVVSPPQPRYPPVAVANEAPQARVFEARLAAGERLAISNLAFPFAPDPEIAVYVDGEPLRPMASDAITTLWTCGPCGDSRVRIEVRAGSLDHLDMVVF